MRIYESLKSILDYVKSKLATVATTGSYNDLTDKPATNELYDLKVVPQAIIEKGWTNINNIARKDLLKTAVPKMYADILEKFNNVETEQSNTVYVKQTKPLPQIYHNGYYYFAGNGTQGSEKYIYRSPNLDLSQSELFCDLSQLTTIQSSGKVFINKNSNYILIVYIAQYNGYNTSAVLYDLDLNYIGSCTIENAPTSGSENYFFDDNYFYVGEYRRYNFVDSIINNVSVEIKSISIGDRYKSLFYDTETNILYLCYNNDSTTKKIYTADFDNGTYSVIYNFTNLTGNNVKPELIKFNGSLIYFYDKYIFKQNGDTWTKQNLPESYNNQSILPIAKYNETYYIPLVPYRGSHENVKILTTNDFINFTVFFRTSELSDGNPIFSKIIVNENDFVYCWYFGNYGRGYRFYFGMLPKTYTDTYTINGNSVNINYYKYNDWKICVPDVSNDENLETVYAALGYLPYWRIDTENEIVTPVRVKNKFTYMYVGDNYQDLELPLGNWERSALYSELSEKQDLLPERLAYAGYFLSYDNDGLKWDFPRSAIQFETVSDGNLLNGVEISFLSFINPPSPKTTKSNGLATFTDLDGMTNFTIQISKDGYITQQNVYYTSFVFNFFTVEMLKVQVTFTVVDENSNPIAGATVSLSSEISGTTDENGQITFEQVLDGTYNYSVSKPLFDTVTGSITVARTSQSQSTILYPAPVEALAMD